MSNNITLTDEQIELLLEFERLSEQSDDAPVLVPAERAEQLDRLEREVDDPVVVSRQRAERLDNCEDALREIVQKGRSLDDSTVERMGADALLSEVQALGTDDSVTALTSQMPTAGGLPAVDQDETDDGLDLSADERAEIRDKLERADRFDSRLPEHCETLRSEACAQANLERDELDELEREVL